MGVKKEPEILTDVIRSELSEIMELLFRGFHKIFAMERKLEELEWLEVSDNCKVREGEDKCGLSGEKCLPELCSRKDWLERRKKR